MQDFSLFLGGFELERPSLSYKYGTEASEGVAEYPC
jgi:hypothetical protein